MSSQRSIFVKSLNGEAIPMQLSKTCILYRIPKSSLPDALKSKCPVKIVTPSALNAQVLNNGESRSLFTDVSTAADTDALGGLYSKNPLSNDFSCTLSSDEIIPSTKNAIQQIEFINIPEPNPLAMEEQVVEPDDDASFTISKKVLREVISEVITDQLKAVHKKLDKISQRLTKIEEGAAKISDPTAPYDSQEDVLSRINAKASSFKWTPVDSLDALIELNNKLNDAANSSYAVELAEWILPRIKVEHSRGRLTKMMQIMFTPVFLTYLSWTGRGKKPKIAFSQYNGVIEFFKKVGTTPFSVVDDREISDFFILKLRYSSLNLQRLKKRSKFN